MADTIAGLETSVQAHDRRFEEIVDDLADELVDVENTISALRNGF